MKRILNLIACLFGFHEWTTPFLERKCEIDNEAIDKFGPLKAFEMDSTMFCKHCKKVHSWRHPQV